MIGAFALGSLVIFLLPLPLNFLFDLVLSALIGGGAATYAVLRSDEIGGAARTAGAAVVTAAAKVAELDDQYEVSKKVKSTVDEAIGSAKDAMK